VAVTTTTNGDRHHGQNIWRCVVSISGVRGRRLGEKTVPGAWLRAPDEEDDVNPMFNWAIVAERMQTLQAEAEAARRARRLGRIRRPIALAGGLPRRRVAVRGMMIKAVEEL
jgi:hypothetical protein